MTGPNGDPQNIDTNLGGANMLPRVVEGVGASAVTGAEGAAADARPPVIGPPPEGTPVSKAVSTPPGERVPIENPSAYVRSGALNSPDKPILGPNIRR